MISSMPSHFSLMTVKSLPVLLCSVVLTGLAPAAVLLDSQSQTITTYTASGTRSLTFNQFDTLGGTRVLTGVTVAYYFDKTGGSYAVDNDSLDTGLITFSHELKGRLTSAEVAMGGAGTYIAALSEFTTVNPIAANTGDPEAQFDIGGPDYVLFQPADILATGQTAAIGAAFWGPYTGSGTFVINFQALQSFVVDGVGGLQSQTIASQVSPTVQVIYSYEPAAVIPEPASTVLIGLGMLGLMARRRP